MKEKKAQRIKLKLHGHPVKLDGTVTKMAPDGSSLTVEFDAGTLGTVTLYPYGRGESLVDKANCTSAIADGVRLFEVL